MGIDPLHWLPKEVLFLEPESHCGGLQCLPLGTPIYCHPGLYSLLHLQPSLIHFVFLGQAGWETLLLIGERMTRRQAEGCLGLWSARSGAQLWPPVRPSSSSACARQHWHVGIDPLQVLHSFSGFYGQMIFFRLGQLTCVSSTFPQKKVGQGLDEILMQREGPGGDREEDRAWGTGPAMP